MASLNKVFFFANLTDHPVLSKTSTGEAVVNFRVAINEAGKVKDVGGKKVTEEATSTFLDIEAFGRLAEKCSEKLKKGSFVFVDGKLKSIDWGEVAKSKIYVRASGVQFLDFCKIDRWSN